MGEYTSSLTLHRWIYVNDNPIYYIDPSGHIATPGDSGGTETSADIAYYEQRNRALYCQAGYTLYCSYAENHPVDTIASLTVGLLGAGVAAALLTPAGSVTAGTFTTGTNALTVSTYMRIVQYGSCGGTALETANRVCGGDMCESEIYTGSNYINEGWKLTLHAIEKMIGRGITIDQVNNAINNGSSFYYYHDGIWKLGFWDTNTKILVATNSITRIIYTVISNVSENYIHNLLNRMP